jgi:5-methylcytosine-specific restriction endonuclease McrA
VQDRLGISWVEYYRLRRCDLAPAPLECFCLWFAARKAKRHHAKREMSEMLKRCGIGRDYYYQCVRERGAPKPPLEFEEWRGSAVVSGLRKRRLDIGIRVRELDDCGCLTPTTVVAICGKCGPVALKDACRVQPGGRLFASYQCRKCGKARIYRRRKAHPEIRLKERERAAAKAGRVLRRRLPKHEAEARAKERLLKRLRTFRPNNQFNSCERWPIAGKLDMRKTYRWQLIVNPDTLRAQMRLSRRRRKNRMTAQPGDASATQIASLLSNAKRCRYCGCWFGKKEKTIEHFMPLSRGGTNQLSNLGVACRNCNNKKGAKLPSQFAVNGQPMLCL